MEIIKIEREGDEIGIVLRNSRLGITKDEIDKILKAAGYEKVDEKKICNKWPYTDSILTYKKN